MPAKQGMQSSAMSLKMHVSCSQSHEVKVKHEETTTYQHT